MELHYHSTDGPTRQRSLSREEEKSLAEQGEDNVSTELYNLLMEIRQCKAEDYYVHPQLLRLNSLIWIWVQMKPKIIQGNIRILMARKNIASINELAKKMRMNASFIGRLLSLEGSLGFCGWNTDNVLRLARVLDALPELMMTTDLCKTVGAEVGNWQI